MSASPLATHASYVDPAGHEYGPGDYVAISTVSDRTPKTVIGRVIQINATDSSGKPLEISRREYVGPPPPPDGADEHYHEAWLKQRNQAHNWAYKKYPGATVKVEILNPSAWSTRSINTYRKINNIFRIEKPEWA